MIILDSEKSRGCIFCLDLPTPPEAAPRRGYGVQTGVKKWGKTKKMDV